MSDAVKDAIADLNVDGWTQSVTSVERIGGIDRFETAAMIASKAASSTSGIGDTVFIANGFSYADALAAGAGRGKGHGAHPAGRQDAVPTATSAFLTAHPGITKAVVVGGPSVVATQRAGHARRPAAHRHPRQRARPVRHVRGDREVRRRQLRHDADLCVLVTGENYPDGLAAVGISAFQHTPILLTPRASLSSAVTDFYSTYPVILPELHRGWGAGGLGRDGVAVQRDPAATRVRSGHHRRVDESKARSRERPGLLLPYTFAHRLHNRGIRRT